MWRALAGPDGWSGIMSLYQKCAPVFTIHGGVAALARRCWNSNVGVRFDFDSGGCCHHGDIPRPVSSNAIIAANVLETKALF